MGKIDLDRVPARTASSYPQPWAAAVAGRTSWKLGDAAGLSQFGATLTEMLPGSRSSLRHWHAEQDEFIVMLDGELVLEMDSGETVMRAGDCAAFPAGVADGHCMVNRSDRPGRFICIGTRTDTDTGHYPGIDLKAEVRGKDTVFTRCDGTPYPKNT